MSVLLLAVCVGAAACRDAIAVCPADLRIGVAPSDTTIAPGEQFQTRVTILGCGGTQVLADSLTWTSSDVGIAVVGTHTGVVIGARPGSVTVLVVGKKYGRIGEGRVTVR